MESTPHIHLRFAALSILAVAGLATAATFAGRQYVRASEEHSVTESTSVLVAAPVGSLLDAGDRSHITPLADATRERLDTLTAPMIAGGVTAVRVWSADGVALYSAGNTAPDGSGHGAFPPTGSSSARITGAGGAPLFATYARNGNLIVEADQPLAPIESRIASTERSLTNGVIATAVGLFLLFQAGFWLSVRGVTKDRGRLLRLYSVGEELRASLDLHDVLTQLARDATELARGDYGLVALYEAETGDLLLRSSYDRGTGIIAHHQRAVEEWFLRRSVATNTTIVSAASATAYKQFFPDVEIDGQVNVVAVPMSLRDRVVGVVAVVRRPAGRRSAFAPIEVRQVVDLASQGAMAVEQAQLFKKVRAYASEVELSYDSTLKALMAALDAKDDVTEGHCERVAKLTVHLARQMGVADKALVDIERGALLHDVGKIGVPDAVLKKPNALTDSEWEAIRKHPLLAGVMIAKVKFLEGATPILLYHHERYDGGGYPFHLSAEKIPVEARIFSVVDAYDAMTSNRPYRDAMPHEAAMAEILTHSGTQFDPMIASAFKLMMESRPELRSRTHSRREAEHYDIEEEDLPPATAVA